MTTPSESSTLARAGGVAALLALLTAVLGLAAPSASAHAALVSSDPASGARISGAPNVITLRFSEDVDPAFVAVTLSAGTGPARPLTPQVAGRTVTARLSEAPDGDATSDRWKIAYRVTSADGHPISGSVTFTVRPEAAVDPGESAPQASSSAPPSAGDAAISPAGRDASRVTQPSPWPAFIIIGGAATAGAGGVGWWIWKRRREHLV